MAVKTKKAQPTAAQNVSPPLENPWFALRATKEKAAHSGDQFNFLPFVVSFYDKVRTYFEEKC
jgi:hypothetical protein